MRPSLKSTETETQPDELEKSNKDLDRFLPSPTSKRLDDKAATLEAELSGLKQSFARERYIYLFVMSVLFVTTLGPNMSGAMLIFLIAAVLIFLIAMGKYLDFPWIVIPLERWHDLIFNAAERRLNRQAIEVEPDNKDDR